MSIRNNWILNYYYYIPSLWPSSILAFCLPLYLVNVEELKKKAISVMAKRYPLKQVQKPVNHPAIAPEVFNDFLE